MCYYLPPEFPQSIGKWGGERMVNSFLVFCSLSLFPFFGADGLGRAGLGLAASCFCCNGYLHIIFFFRVFLSTFARRWSIGHTSQYCALTVSKYHSPNSPVSGGHPFRRAWVRACGHMFCGRPIDNQNNPFIAEVTPEWRRHARLDTNDSWGEGEKGSPTNTVYLRGQARGT